MFKILRILIISVGIISSNTYATVVEKTDLGEQPFDVLPPDHVLTINDFIRMNKTFTMNRVLVVCEMKKEISRVSDYINRLTTTIKNSNIDVQKFKDIEFVNIECLNGNFAYEVMEESPVMF